MPSHFPLEKVRVVGRRKYRQRKAVPEFTSNRNERLEILVNFCIRNLDSKGGELERKSCAAMPMEMWRHSLSKIKRAVSMKIMIENRKRGNIAAEIKRKKTVMRGGELMRRIAFDSIMLKRFVCVEPSKM